MPIIERRWKETRGTRTFVKANKTINGIENPWIGTQLGNYRDRAARELGDGFYAIAWLIEEYGDEAIEEVAELSEEERDAYVGEIEIRIADNDEDADPRSALQDVMEN